MIITTSQKASPTIKKESLELANSLGLSYVERHKKPISELFLIDNPIAVVSNKKLTIHFNEWLNCEFYV